MNKLYHSRTKPNTSCPSDKLRRLDVHDRMKAIASSTIVGLTNHVNCKDKTGIVYHIMANIF